MMLHPRCGLSSAFAASAALVVAAAALGGDRALAQGRLEASYTITFARIPVGNIATVLELGASDLLKHHAPKSCFQVPTSTEQVQRELLMKLHDKPDVLDWHARQQTRADAQSTIRFTLNELPEEPYPEAMWQTKVDAAWAYIFSRAQQRTGLE